MPEAAEVEWPLAVARLEQRVAGHDSDLKEIKADLRDATSALWAAVRAVETQSSVTPVMALIVSVLVGLVGVLGGMLIGALIQ